MNITIKQVFENILPKKAHRVKDKIKDLNGIFSVDAVGENGGKWTLKITNGSVEVTRGIHDKADCIVKAEAKTWNDLFNGKLSYMKALLFGKLKVTGNKRLALKVTTKLLG